MDERTRQQTRGSGRTDPASESRTLAEDDRETVGLASDDALIEEFANSFARDTLPIPRNSKPGWHYCWLTTSNPRDSVEGRLRLGYQLCRADEFPELKGYAIASGEHAGIIGVNEMILSKIPEERYQKIMRHFHDRRPKEEESAIKARVEALAQDMNARRGGQFATVEGFDPIPERGRARAFE